MGTLRRLLALAGPVTLTLHLGCLPPPAPTSPAKVASAPPLVQSDSDPAVLSVASSGGKPRTEAQIVVELQGLERAAEGTTPESPDRPGLYRRLAEGYVELESAALRDQIDHESTAAAQRAKDPTAELRSADAERAGVVAAARHKAIKYYQALATKYPTFCVSPGVHCGDEVLYHLAYEHEQARSEEDARRVYLDLVKQFPQSTYLPHAYLAFAEHLFVEAQSDASRFALAEQAYRKAAEAVPPPENAVWGYAHYKLAYVYWNQGDTVRALVELQDVIEFATRFPSLPNAERLGVTARRDLVPVYALKGDPEKAFEYFKPLSGDPAGDARRTLAMSVDLGQSYLDTGHYKECVLLDLDLLRRAPGEPSCAPLAQLDHAMLRATKTDAAALQAALARGKQRLDQARKSCSGQPVMVAPGALHKCASTDPCNGL